MKTKPICYDPLCEIHNKAKPTDEKIAREAADRVWHVFHPMKCSQVETIILEAIKRAKE
jgi:hypothetical protein